MLVPFPSPVTQLIDTGIALLRGISRDRGYVENSLKIAGEFNKSFINNINISRAFLPDNEDVNVLVNNILICADKREKAIEKIEEYFKSSDREILQVGVTEFQQSSFDIQMSFLKLSSKTEPVDALSPVPVVDDFARTFSLVLSGKITFEQAKAKLADLELFRDFVKRDLDFFLYIYPDEIEAGEKVRKALEKLNICLDRMAEIAASNDKASISSEVERIRNVSKELLPLLEELGHIRKKKIKIFSPCCGHFASGDR